ncbi:MAG: 50S ribosomal protein L22 [Clostridia bacterium]|nr:50S ribosomal protein L22 [Clostridia bacterium]
MATRQREKSAKIAASRDKRAKAIARYVRISPSKVRVVLDVIRGKDYLEAVAVLKNISNTSAEAVLKVLESAGANAENNLGLNKADLYVAETFADAGQTLKRFQPVSKGRAHSILKRTSHITVILDVKA